MQRIDTLLQDAAGARREGRPADARRDYAQAVALSRQPGASRGQLVRALKGLGQIERDTGRLDAALRHYLEAADVCRDMDDPLLLAHTIRHVGDIHQDAGRHADAEPCYVEALAIYEANPSTGPLDLANALRPAALLMQATDRPEAARKYWSKARKLYAAAGIEAGVEECDSNLAALDR